MGKGRKREERKGGEERKMDCSIKPIFKKWRKKLGAHPKGISIVI